MDKLKFKVSAELKNILGRDLITSPYIAILELVKNSYDAHATKVEITFDTDYIEIADNGKGMSLDDLINKWLFVAYSAKSDGSEDISYRSKFKRHFAGAKGIGRMSCDRLARNLTLITKSESSETVESIEVDWADFENQQKQEFSSVAVNHNSMTSTYRFPMGSKTGTVLKFSGIHDNWGIDEILGLRGSLEKLINPFSETDDFRIEIIAPSFASYDAELTKKIEDLQNQAITDGEDFAEKIAKLRNSQIGGYIENSISDVLKIKTTQIESILKDGTVKTVLTDRGVVMYEIEELSKYNKLEDVVVSLYFLNRAAKYSFTARMGIQPVNYGNVFLFRNGIRILPYGEFNDDSWGLNQRAQQGYNRTIGTRDLFGRVDVLTNSVSEFKEVSSRDGGLISNESTKQLMDYFNETHRRLERYVTGVLWGEAFLKNEYFKNTEMALEAREEVKKNKDSNSADDIFKNIGSKVDFLQLIKNLVNDNKIVVRYYNSTLADVVSSVEASEVLQSKFLEDMRKVAEKTNDNELRAKLDEFELQLTEMRRQKEEADRKAEAEHKKATEAKRKAEKEKAAREKAEKERDAQIQKNNYLSATRDTSKEVEDLMHTVLISSSELNSLVSSQKEILNEDPIDKQELVDITHDLEFNVERIHVLSSLITKADTALLRDSVDVDVYKYAHEFLSYFSRKLTVSCIADEKEDFLKKIQVLEYSVILQNLVSNSRKANASNIIVIFKKEDRRVLIDFSDDGVGVDLDLYTPETIFEVGVTNRPGGHGIGLSTIRDTLKRCMNGDIQFVGNGINNLKGATFRIILE